MLKPADSFSIKRFSSLLILVILFLLGVILRAIGLDRSLGGFDENHYLLYFGYSSFQEIVLTFFSASNHIFHTLLMRMMMLGFGDENEIAIRAVSFLSGIIGLWMIYKLALKLFDSLWIARVSLLFAAVCPIHVLYSQTARGYALMMLLSVSATYAILKVLENGRFIPWGIFVILLGFLSSYTLPTSVYFIFGLSGWVFLVLFLSSWRRDFDFAESSPKKCLNLMAGIFIGIALLTVLVYLPIKDQIVEVARYDVRVAKEMYGLKENMIQGVFLGMLPDTLTLIFQSSLKWFLPFLGVGIICGGVIFKSYRWLPVCIFLLPVIPTLLTGVSGYPRNYLFNLPLLVIFLASGIFKTGEWISSFSFRLRNGGLVRLCLVSVYFLVSLKVLFTEHYPSLQIDDGRMYKKELQKNTNSLDLILIGSSKIYLYGQSVFKYNLKNIFLLQKMRGVHAVLPKNTSLQKLPLLIGSEQFFIFKNLFIKNSLNFKSLGDGKKLYTISNEPSSSVLPEDIESIVDWKILKGSGEFMVQDQVKFFGKQALFMAAESDESFEIQGTILKNVHIEKPSMVVLLDTELPDNKKDLDAIIPRLTLTSREYDLNDNLLLMGLVNPRLVLLMKENKDKKTSYVWRGAASLGLIPPGNYSINLRLLVRAGESTLYDGFRLFFSELKEAS